MTQREVHEEYHSYGKSVRKALASTWLSALILQREIDNGQTVITPLAVGFRHSEFSLLRASC